MKNYTYKYKSGVSILVVLTFMFVSLLLGSAFLYMSKKNIETQGAFYHIKTAYEASESALDWFAILFSKNDRDVVLNTLNSLDSTKVYYYSGNPNLFEFNFTDVPSSKKLIDLSGDGKFKAELIVESYDKKNFILKLKSVGYGYDGSKKTIHAIYKVAGIDNLNSYVTYSDKIARHALYSKSGWHNLSGSIKIDGDAYAGNGAVFNQGSEVNGDLKIMGADQPIHFNGTVTLKGNVYVEGNVKFNTGPVNIQASDSAKYFWVDGKVDINSLTHVYIPVYFMSGFENYNADLYLENNAYINWNNKDLNYDLRSNGDSLIINGTIGSINDKDIYIMKKDGVFKYEGNIDPNKVDFLQGGTLINNAGYTPIDREAILGPNGDKEEEEISVDIEALKQKVDIKLSDYFSAAEIANGNFKAQIINDLYKNGSVTINGKTITWDKDNDQDGILTIDFDLAANDAFDDGKLEGGVKVALIINADVNSNQKFWGSTVKLDENGNPIDEESSTTLLVEGNGSINNIGLGKKDDDKINYFRGLVYTESGMGTMDHAYVYGAIIDKSKNVELNINNDAIIKYDNDALAAFLPLGVFKDPNGETIEPKIVKKPENYMSNLYLQLLSKY